MPQCVLQVLPSVLKAVPHPEDFRICEDSTFVRRVIAAGYGAVHIEEEGAQRVQSRLLRQRATGRSVRRVAPRASQAIRLLQRAIACRHEARGTLPPLRPNTTGWGRVRQGLVSWPTSTRSLLRHVV